MFVPSRPARLLASDRYRRHFAGHCLTRTWPSGFFGGNVLGVYDDDSVRYLGEVSVRSAFARRSRRVLSAGVETDAFTRGRATQRT